MWVLLGPAGGQEPIIRFISCRVLEMVDISEKQSL